jgi:formylglycine-generating enzyme required for sulfatase activity
MFYRTYTSDPGDGAATGQTDPASVSGFRLDKYLVTVGRFRAFVTAWNQAGGLDGGTAVDPQPASGKHGHLNGGSGLNSTLGGYELGWLASYDANILPTDANLSVSCSRSTWTPVAGDNEYLPMSCVNWYEAWAFCIWDGGFLPTDAEWEYAAAGGGGPDGQREYPWGSVGPWSAGTGAPTAYAVYGIDAALPVGTTQLGQGLWGQFDLIGEVWEWELDWDDGYVTPCNDCVNLAPNTARSIRGSSYQNGTEWMPVPTTYPAPPASRDPAVGVRCARIP